MTSLPLSVDLNERIRTKEIYIIFQGDRECQPTPTIFKLRRIFVKIPLDILSDIKYYGWEETKMWL